MGKTVYPNPDCRESSYKHTCHCLSCGASKKRGQTCCGRVLNDRSSTSCSKYIAHPKEKFHETVIIDGLRHLGRTYTYLRPPGQEEPRLAETFCDLKTHDFEQSKKRHTKCDVCF